ncbi:MAG: leucine-rich repeat protein [Kiritimatiellia bacterium]
MKVESRLVAPPFREWLSVAIWLCCFVSAFGGSEASLISIAEEDEISDPISALVPENGELSIPATVGHIGPHAFKRFVGLRKVTVGAGVEIETDAFRNCTSLVEVVIRSQQKIIPDRAFAQCSSLERVVLPESVDFIGRGAFAGCSSLKTFDLPRNMRGFDELCFLRCDRLRAFFVAEENEFLEAIDGIVYSKDGTLLWAAPTLYEKDELRIPDGVRRIHCSQFRCTRGLRKVSLPSSLEEGDFSFGGDSDIEWFDVDQGNTKLTSHEGLLYSANCQVLWRCPPAYSRKEVKLARECKEIGTCAFNACRAEWIVLPVGVEKLPRERAFGGCGNLRRVTLPDTVDIGYDCFTRCPQLTDIDIVKNGGGLVFERGFLLDARRNELLYCAPVFTNGVIRLPEGVVEVRYGAFANIRETCRVEIPAMVKHVYASDVFRFSEVVFEGDYSLAPNALHQNHLCSLYVDFHYPRWRSFAQFIAASDIKNIVVYDVSAKKQTE